jgi:hypothetical protein
MVLKKNLNQIDSEINISQLLRQWWHYRKLVFFGTILIFLISSFILIISHKIFSNQKQKYVMAILQGDLGENNKRINSALRSTEYISETLVTLGLDLDPDKIISNFIIKFNSDPFRESLQDRILSLNDKDIRKLALSNEVLSTITKSLNNSSKDLISISFYHEPLNISYEQANNFLVSLIQNVNKKILVRTNRETLNLKIINTKNLNKYYNNSEKLARLTTVINSVQSNLTVMQNYDELLHGIDLDEYFDLTNITQKLLYEFSKSLGNTIALDSLEINILNKERDITDLKYSLNVLKTDRSLKINNDSISKQNSDEITNNTQLDGAIFDKILDIGSEISMTKFRLETISKIQKLQQERNMIIQQIELLNLPIEFDEKNYKIKNVEERIKLLANDVNDSIVRIRNFTQPKAAVLILKKPELVVLNSKNISELIKYVGIYTLIGFFIISFILFLIPYKK